MVNAAQALYLVRPLTYAYQIQQDVTASLPVQMVMMKSTVVSTYCFGTFHLSWMPKYGQLWHAKLVKDKSVQNDYMYSMHNNKALIPLEEHICCILW